jgi:zinc protease
MPNKASAPTKKISIPGITFVQELDGISEYTLDKNGLRILLIPDNSVPVAGCMVTYHVGSRNEATGYTGATHLLEHLMFKGSKNFNDENGKSTKSYLEQFGGMLNASTSVDYTNYYEVLPTRYLQEAITLEADRMRNAYLHEPDRQAEMPIVRNEFERGENLPVWALDKQMWALAFEAHPYHHSTIGWKSDIEGVSIERLQQFYNDFYWPNNATVTIAGSFNSTEILQTILKEFGKHPAAQHAFPTMYTEEPPQEGERRAVVKRAGVDVLGMVHKIPNAQHADIPALTLLAVILSDDKTSRLYRAFIDTAKATDVSVYSHRLHDPSLFQTYITLTSKISHATAEKLLRNEYTKIIEKGVTKKELQRAKLSVRSYVASRRDGTYSLLSSINDDIAAGEWTRFVTFPKDTEKVTAQEIQQVAKKYLIDDHVTIGWFINTAK